jgi:hypothetical protein
MKVETLAEQLLFTTVNIQKSGAGGEVSCGKGFVYGVETDQGTAHVLISNRHVLEDALGGLLIRAISARPDGGPMFGQVQEISLAPDHAADTTFVHTDRGIDLALLPFSPMVNLLRDAGTPLFYRSVPAAMSLTRDNVGELDAFEKVVFIGYPNNLSDRANNTPIVRQGTTASPIALDYNGRPVFLIDAAVYPGSSGSPVFLYDGGSYMNRAGQLMAGSRTMFLGVLASVHVRSVEAEVVETTLGRVKIDDPLNLGLVFKAHAVDELVDAFLESHGLRRVAEQPTEPAEQSSPEADKALEDGAEAA